MTVISPINSNIQIKQNFFTRRYNWQYQADIKLSNLDLLKLLAVLSTSLASILKPSSLIKNVKGRDRLNVISSKLELPFEQELLACDFSWNPASFDLARSGESSENSCALFLLSPFDHFAEKDIFHRVVQTVTGEAPPEISLNQIINDTRLQLKSFRMGIDTFGQSSFANWFISAPVVLEGIIIEASAEDIKLKIQSEGHKSKGAGLYNYYDLMNKVLATFRSLFNLDLKADLENKLKY